MKEIIKETIAWLKKKGVDYADIRQVKRISESIKVKNREVEAVSKSEDVGFGIRVLYKGAWGFASSNILSKGEFKRIANLALQIARASSLTQKEPVRLAENEIHKDKYVSPCQIDPFKVSLDEKLNLLINACDLMLKKPGIKVADTTLNFFRSQQLFANTEGSIIEQVITESGGGATATAARNGETQWRSYPNSHGGDYATRGYEFIQEMELLRHMEKISNEAVALLSAPDCPAQETTVVISGNQMALQVHESCGHPIELDRVLGMEISLAGGSFMTPDKLGNLQYGSPKVNIYADATTPGGLGSFGYDDEGVKAQRTEIIKEGRFVGYLTSRETAPLFKQKSNGTMRADGWNRIPLIRMTNINLAPGDASLENLIADTKQGLYLDTNKSWSIDDKRLNFQFAAEAAWEIKDGKKGQMYKNPIYTGITPDFWNTCDGIGNQSEWHVWGVPNCGKGEPMQTMHVGHGVSPARFTRVKIGGAK
ncbi:MAG: peptidase C69 [candidate division Zixibacteria bacterium RBG_16_48_11]|nr:MAG: peptidase C69 [candidate division Zixibacteria bacterium RBG_16_48_11]